MTLRIKKSDLKYNFCVQSHLISFQWCLNVNETQNPLQSGFDIGLHDVAAFLLDSKFYLEHGTPIIFIIA
jgi:hypothetical protein